MQLPSGKLTTLVLFAFAALFEVAGDALIRRGLRGGGFAILGCGLALLGSYGVAVNLVDLQFSRALGAYIGIFALVSVGIGRAAFGDQVSASTWIGLAIILCGSLVIQLGK